MSFFKKILWGWSSKDDQPSKHTQTAQEEKCVDDITVEVSEPEPKKLTKINTNLLLQRPFFKHKETGEILYTNISYDKEKYHVTNLVKCEDVFYVSISNNRYKNKNIIVYSSESNNFNIDEYNFYTTRKEIIELYNSIKDDSSLKYKFELCLVSYYLDCKAHYNIFKDKYKLHAKVTDRYVIKRDFDHDRVNSYRYSNFEDNYDYEYYDLETGVYDTNINNFLLKLFLEDTDIDVLINQCKVELLDYEEFKSYTSEIYEKHKLKCIADDEKYYNDCIEEILKEYYKINLYLEDKGLPKLLPVNDLPSFMQFIEVMNSYEFVPDVRVYDYENINTNSHLKYTIARYFSNIKEI